MSEMYFGRNKQAVTFRREANRKLREALVSESLSKQSAVGVRNVE